MKVIHCNIVQKESMGHSLIQCPICTVSKQPMLLNNPVVKQEVLTTTAMRLTITTTTIKQLAVAATEINFYIKLKALLAASYKI